MKSTIESTMSVSEATIKRSSTNQGTIVYEAFTDITKVNNIQVSNAKISISGSQIKIDGSSTLRKTVINSDQSEQTTDVTATLLDKVNIKLGKPGASSTHQATLSSDKKSWSLTLTPIPVGLADGDGNLQIEAIPVAKSAATPLATAPDKITIQVDNQPPSLTINKPAAGDLLVLTNGTAPVTLEVTATDNKGLDQTVKWAVQKPGDPPPALASYNTVQLNQGKATVATSLTAAGEHTFHVRAADTTGNIAERSVHINVTQQFTPIDPENVTGLSDYFGNLLKFAALRIKVGGISASPGSTSATPSQLDGCFFQRFQELLDLLSTEGTRRVVLQSVNHSRICIDILRRYLNNRLPQVNLNNIQSTYRRQAYDALLRALGTSDKELRMAVIGDTDTRTALADRLRIGPEALAGLLLPRDSVTEADLQRVFGMAQIDSIKDPFAPTEPQPPVLLDKRRASLQAAWQAQDEATRHPVFGITLPVLDPDLVQADNLRTDKARGLWADRRAQVDDKLKVLRDIPRPDNNLLGVFRSIVDTALGAGAAEKLIGAEKTTGLFDLYGAGQDIEPAIHALYLEAAPFLYLMNFHRMLKSGVKPLNDEWEQVFSVLAQAIKLSNLYPIWRSIELTPAKLLRLGPDDFKLPASVDQQIDLPLWRASHRAYQFWLDRLAARINQAAALEEELRSVIDVAEADALPQLRDALIKAIGTAVGHAHNVDTADELTGELLIDFKSTPRLKTSRIEQANETLQGILFAVRMGQLAKNPVKAPNSNPASAWILNTNNGAYSEKDFDEEWRWMGSYNTWLSAIDIFLFPENYVRPAVRLLPDKVIQVPKTQTKAFNDLLVRLRQKSRLTQQLARQEASDYLAALKKELFPPDGIVSSTSPLKSFFDNFQLNEPVSLQQIRSRRAKNNEAFSAVFPQGSPQPQKFHDVPAWLQEVFYFVPLLLAEQLERCGEYLSAIDWYQAVYAYTEPLASDRLIYQGLALESNTESFGDDPNWLLADFNPHRIALTRGKVYTRFAIAGLTRCLSAFADDQFTQETVETLPLARSLYLAALDLLDLPQMQVAPQFGNRKLENSLIRSLRDHAESHLRKLRNGLNIAGLERPRRAQDTSRAVTRYPTPYRYGVLIERAKQLTATAAQIEASFLAALEKADAERYALLQAQQDVELGRAQVQLQNLRVVEAENGVQLTRLQKDRAQIQAEHFEDLLEQDLLPEEEAMLRGTRRANTLKGIGDLLAVGAAVAATVATGGAAAPVVLGALAVVGRDAAGAAGGFFAGRAEVKSILASFERRRQEWQLQLSLAQQDLLITDQQIKLALDQVQITQQELKIASIQIQHALNNLNFLSNKFTGAELFDWMSQVLEKIYAFFLRQAATIARLAEAQLAYERQEAVPTFIRADYWRTSEGSLFGNGDGVDRRGLTGSARLLRDLTELDQFAFTTDSRKLQLSKTFSLSALDPVRFQRFLETGIMQFATLMDHYDREFPGHYLRLIKRVRVSVIALTPPTQGIRATLSNMGVSRVVINDNGFRPVVVHHGPQSVALSAPLNATGLFELDVQPEMLVPFESIGVHTAWEFRLPKPANPFDFNTIADVLITFDYTAFDSSVYRRQVIENLNPVLSIDQPYSLRNQFPDQWYDLHHPEQTDTPMVIRFSTTRADFPPHLDVLSIQHLSLVIAGSGETALEMPTIQLRFREQGSADAFVGGKAIPFNGLVSTRRGAGNWQPILGKPPIGEWEFDLTDPGFKDLFKDEKIEDLLLVVTYEGRLPAWPAQ